MAYGTAAHHPVDRAIDDTYRRVLRHTETCRPCNTDGMACTRGDELRADHRAALTEARQ